jgi:hypothetical protein
LLLLLCAKQGQEDSEQSMHNDTSVLCVVVFVVVSVVEFVGVVVSVVVCVVVNVFFLARSDDGIIEEFCSLFGSIESNSLQSRVF